VASLPPSLRGVSIQKPRVTFKLCIDDAGRVRRALKLLSSGNADVDDFYCRQFRSWTFAPQRVEGVAVNTVELVTVTLYR
jgi:hypothetical protein